MDMEISGRQLFELFKSVTMLEVQMETLDLLPDTLQHAEPIKEEKPRIFTVECQLSRELTQRLPRYDSFNVMHFESTKIEKGTQQIIHFGSKAIRHVGFELDNIDAVLGLNFGRLHFTIWWRQPLSCLHEMLGSGTFEVENMYKDIQLESEKAIPIHQHGLKVGTLKFKIQLIGPKEDKKEV